MVTSFATGFSFKSNNRLSATITNKQLIGSSRKFSAIVGGLPFKCKVLLEILLDLH